MGEHGQSFARTDLSVEEAQRVAANVRGWLTEERIIAPEVNEECVIGRVGHPPGPNWAVVEEEGWLNPRFLELRTNGVKIEGGIPWVVCYPNGADMASDCPSCGSDVGDGFWSVLDDWTKWTEGNPKPTVRCPSCDKESSVVECVLDDSWSLSLVEVTFHNWSKLSEPFQSEMLERLGGNSRFVFGKS